MSAEQTELFIHLSQSLETLVWAWAGAGLLITVFWSAVATLRRNGSL